MDESEKRQNAIHSQGRLDKAASRALPGDGTAEAVSSQRSSRIDEQLIEAVTRNVVQQLQLLSLTGQPNSEANVCQYSDQQSSYIKDDSRTSSQRVALDRFTNELQRYAEHTNAKGKLPVFTPTPARSGCTLRTVSELLPFRPEFKAAGLAVTSKDQAQRRYHPTRASMARAARRKSIRARTQHSRLSQLDGNDASGTTTTEISFFSPKGASDWRYACIEDISPKQKKQVKHRTSSISRCLPCFPNNDDQTTDSERPPTFNDPFKKPGALIASKSRRALSALPKTPAKTPYPRLGCTPHSPPDTGLSIQETIFDVGTSPAKAEDAARSISRAKARMQHPRPAFFAGPRSPIRATGRRRTSMTLPWQDLTAEAPGGRPSIKRAERTHQLRHYPTITAEQLNPRRASRSFRLRDQVKPVVSSPKRYQSLPAKRLPKVFTKLPRNNASLPNLQSAMDRYSYRKPSSEVVAEPPPTRRVSSVAKKSLAGSPKRFDGSISIASVQHPVPLCGRGTPGGPPIGPKIPKRTSSIQGSLYHLALNSGKDVEDRDVLKGLHIAASAACDEQVDKFISQQTGLQIRRFLADLMAFENLGDQELGEDIRERVVRRRSDMKKLKRHIRRSREIGKASLMTAQGDE